MMLEVVDPSLSLRVGAGDWRIVDTAGEWGAGVPPTEWENESRW